tara:strand:+ start:388 stop:915 length:528 start_codon:yes stop_codon:yes gene_type:complete
MAGALIKIDEVIVSSGVSSVSLGASNWDSSYDVYKVVMTAVKPSTDSTTLRMRVLKSNSVQSDSEYDYAYKQLRSDTAFQDVVISGGTLWQTTNNTNGTNGGETAQGIFYLFNFNNASEYSFVTNETSNLTADPLLIQIMGGGVHTVASASNGLSFFYSSDNIASGTFSLYGLRK